MVSMRRVRDKLVLAVSFMAVGTGNIAWADHTHVDGVATMYAHVKPETCSKTACDGSVSVSLTADCDGVNCTVTVATVHSGDCGPSSDILAVTSCKLHDKTMVTHCDGADPAAINLIPKMGNTVPMSQMEWNNAMAGNYDMVAEAILAGSGTASGSGSVTKRAIPTVSSWGVMVMIGLLLVVGTVVFRRSRPELT